MRWGLARTIDTRTEFYPEVQRLITRNAHRRMNTNYTNQTPTEVVSNPTERDAANSIVNGLAADNVILVLCACDVEYDGRAGGYLPTGDRTIIIKPDGNFLVIGSTKHKARNWQPTGAATNVTIENGTLTLESERSSPKEETLTVYCDSVYEIIQYDAGDDPDVTLQGTEKDMHERIMRNPELIEPNFSVLEHEKTVDSGRSIDVFGKDKDGCTVVVEVKRRRGQRKDVDQLHDYTTQFRANGKARGILVAPSVSDNVLEALGARDLEFVELHPQVKDD